jgi:hypothetical protein
MFIDATVTNSNPHVQYAPDIWETYKKDYEETKTFEEWIL